jgi:hypothetical protein
MTADELVVIWQAWDHKPGAENRARDMEDACAAYAPGQVLWFRRELAACRRQGMSRTQALRFWDLLSREQP